MINNTVIFDTNPIISIGQIADIYGRSSIMNSLFSHGYSYYITEAVVREIDPIRNYGDMITDYGDMISIVLISFPPFVPRICEDRNKIRVRSFDPVPEILTRRPVRSTRTRQHHNVTW
jgi:hypothetical protein